LAHIEELSTDPILPDDSFHEELLALVGDIHPFSEDLYEKEYFLEKKWLQVSDGDHHTRLHIFRENGDYLESVDGNVFMGTWSILENSNTIIFEKPGLGANQEKRLFELAFLNEDFFILKKHGNRIGHEAQFLLLGREALVHDLDWSDVVDLIYTRYKNNKKLLRAIILMIALIVLYLIFSSL